MIKPNGFTKTVSVVTSATTILWLSGLAMLAPLAAGAVTINNGDIIRGPDNVKVYIVNTTDGYKRHIFNPAIFNMYGHLKWSNIKNVDQATLNSYATSDLYRADGDPKVYKLEEVSEASGTAVKHHFNMTADQYVASGYNWKQIFVVNTKERDYYSTGSDLTYTGTTTTTPTTPVVNAPATGVAVTLDSTTPAASAVAAGAQDVAFTKISFTAGADQDYTINSLTVIRGGIAADSDISSIKLYYGTTKIGSTQAINSTTHKATFSSIGWKIAKGTNKVLTIKGSIAAGASSGNLIKLGINAASDISLAAGSASGTFPMLGSGFSPTTQAVGRLDLQVQTTPAADTILSGSTEKQIASWKFTATATEGFYIHSIKVTEVGTSVDADISNIKLKVGGVQLGSTAAALVNSTATFDLSAAPIYVQAGGNKTVDAFADISSGVTTSRTVIFEVSVADDVVAYGANSGGMVTLTGPSGNTFTKQTGATMTIGQGSLTVDHYSAIRPAAKDYVKGTNGRLWTAWDFASGSREGVRIVKLVLTASGCSGYTSTSVDCAAQTALTSAQLATDLSNIGLYDYNASTGVYTLISTASLVGGVVTFGANTSNAFDAPGLFDVSASGHKYIAVKADVPTGATSNHGIRLGINANTDIWIDGLSSQNDIAQSATTVTGTTRYSNYHRLQANGTLTSVKGTALAGAVIVQGTTNNTLGWFNLTADSGEDIVVSAINLDLSEGANTADLTESGDVSNLKLYDGSTQLGSTIASPVSDVTFSTNLTIPAGTTKSLKVVGDLPTTGTIALSALRVTLDVSETTATGSASGATISDSNTTDVTQDDLTVASGALTTTVKTPPISQNIIRGSTTPIPFVTFLMTAGVAEDVRVTSIKLTADGDTDGSDFNFGNGTSLSGDNVNSDIDQVYLYDGDYNSTTVLAGPMQLTSGGSATTTNSTVNFTGLSITVPRAGQKVFTVKATVKSTATSNHGISFGVAAAADITATGLSTNSAITLTSTPNSTLTSAVGMNVNTSGALYTALTTGALPSIIMVAGKSGQEFASVKLTAKDTSGNNSSEDLVVSVIRVTANATTALDAGADNIKKVYAYNGSTLLGLADWDSATGTVDIPFTTNLTVKSGQSETITLKADLTTITEGADSGDTPRLGIEYNIQTGMWTANYANKYNIVAKGALSNQNVYVGTSSGNPSANLRGNAMTIRKTVPTISYVASGTNLQTVPGLGEVLRFSVAADLAEDVSLNAVTFRMTSTDVATANQWNEYDASKIALTDFNLYDSTDLTTALSTSSTDWWFLNSSGNAYMSGGVQSSTASGDIVYYAIDQFTTAVSIPKGTTKTFVLKVDTTGAKKQANVSDAVRFDVIGDVSGTFNDTTRTNAHYFKWDDGTSVSGGINGQYVKVLPAQGATVQY